MPSPQQLAEEDRKRAIARGDVLSQESKDRETANINYDNQYTDYLNELYQPDAEGRGGFSSEESRDIMGREGLESLRMTPEEQAGAFLTPEEQAAIAGNPDAQMQYYRPDYLTSMQTGAEAAQRGAAGGLQAGLNAAVDPSKLGLREDYRAEGARTLNEGDTSIQQGVEGTESNVRAALDRKLLAQNPELAGNYRMSDAEKQDIITGAGISAGTGYRALSDSTERAAKAAGTGPLGVAAARERNERSAAGEAGDAMTQARIKADAEQAAREMALEQNRQQTEQYISGATTANEQALGSRRLAAQNEALARRLGFSSDAERMRMGGEQGISDRQIRAASEGGQAALDTERAIQGQQQQVGQFNTTTGMEGARTSEAMRAGRSRDIAGNRQQTQQGLTDERYRRGAAENEQISQRAGRVADRRLTAQDRGRDYYSGRQTQANQNVNAEANRQGNLYSTQGSLAQGATGNTIQASAQPKWWEKATGAVLGAVGAVKPYGFNRGGVITKPTVGTVAEEGPEYVGPVGGGGRVVTEPTTAVLGAEGPETAVPLNNEQDNFTRPSLAYGREVIRKPRMPQRRQMYGEMALA